MSYDARNLVFVVSYQLLLSLSAPLFIHMQIVDFMIPMRTISDIMASVTRKENMVNATFGCFHL